MPSNYWSLKSVSNSGVHFFDDTNAFKADSNKGRRFILLKFIADKGRAFFQGFECGLLYKKVLLLFILFIYCMFHIFQNMPTQCKFWVICWMFLNSSLIFCQQEDGWLCGYITNPNEKGLFPGNFTKNIWDFGPCLKRVQRDQPLLQ